VRIAGHYKVDPGQTPYHLPAHPALNNTRVVVTNPNNQMGRISMTAGGSATEFDDLAPGTTNFDRDFAGVELAVKDEEKVTLTVETR
jgi:hypothetical protein